MPAPAQKTRQEAHAASQTQAPPLLDNARILLMLAVFGAVFVATLAATLPATLVSGSLGGANLRATGTAWSGEATLASGDRLSWRTDVLASILSLSAQADISVSGPRTGLTARLSAGSDVQTFSNITGIAGTKLLRFFAPDIRLECDVGVRFAGMTVMVRNSTPFVSGRASAPAGNCTDIPSQKAFVVPATEAVATSRDGRSRIHVFLAGNPAGQLANVEIGAAGGMKAVLQPAALELVPGAVVSGPVEYEIRAP